MTENLSNDEWLEGMWGHLRQMAPDPYPYGAPSPEKVPEYHGCAAIVCDYGVMYRSCGNGAGLIEITQSGSVLPLCDTHKQKATDVLANPFLERIDRLNAILEGRRLGAERRKREQTKSEIVYFLLRSDGAVKIGRSANLDQRKRDLESAAGPLELLCTVPGGKTVETRLHKRFKSQRLHGEWFRLDAEISEFIETICENDASL